MNLTTKALAAGLLLFASVAIAEEKATDPTVIARQELMDTIGKNIKVLGDMAGDKAAFDAAAADTAKAAIIAASGEIATRFEPQATDPASAAKPEIWTSWDDFVTKANGLNTAATGIDVASIDGVKAGMDGLGGACKACHSVYRMQK